MRWLLPLALACTLQASCAFDEPDIGGSSQYSIIDTTDTSFHAAGTIAADEEHLFAIPVGEGATNINVHLTGSGDADLYTRWAVPPTESEFQCRPYVDGSDEQCVLYLRDGQLYVMVRGWANVSDYDLNVTWQAASPGDVADGIGTSPGPEPN